MTDSPATRHVEVTNLELDARRRQANPQHSSYEQDSIPRSPGLEKSLQRIKNETQNETQNESFTAEQNLSSCNNYVLRSRPLSRWMTERVELDSTLFCLDNEDTFSGHTFSGRLERNGIFTREVEAAGDDSNESRDVTSKIISESHDRLQLQTENEGERATSAYNNRKTARSAICQAEERALPAQGPLGDRVHTKIEDDFQTPEKGFLDWKSFQRHFYKHKLCLGIGSWICDGEYPGYPDEEVAPAISMIETGRYPKHLNDENLGANQCAGNTASPSGSSGSSCPTKETAKIVANAAVEKKLSKGKKRISDNDDNDDDENDTNHDGKNEGRRTRARCGFVCPLQRRLSQVSGIDNETRVKYRVCMTSKFDDIARVKEHLARVHNDIVCARCQKTFKKKEQFNSHLTEDLPCKKRPSEPQLMIMTDDEVKKLEAMKKARGHEPDKWRQIYQIFFPGSSAPSPYEHDPNIVASVVLPKDTEVVDFLKDQLPDLLWSKLEPTFDNMKLNATQKGHLKCQILSLGSSIHTSFQAQHDPLEHLCPEPPGSLDHNALFSGSGSTTTATMNPSPSLNFHGDQQCLENDNFAPQGNEYQPTPSVTAFAINGELNYQAQISSNDITVAKDQWNRPLHAGVSHPRQPLQPSQAVQPVPPQTPNNSRTMNAQFRIYNRPTSSPQASVSDSGVFSLPSSGQCTLEGRHHRSSMGSMTSPCPNPKDPPDQGHGSSKAPLEDAYRNEHQPWMNESWDSYIQAYIQGHLWHPSDDFANQDNQDENFWQTNGSQ